MPRDKLRAHLFIKRHYREPATEDPIERWLPHPQVARRICGVLFIKGVPFQDMEDAMQEVLCNALAAFRNGNRVPPNLREMKIYCTKVTRNYVANERRKAARREELGFVGICERHPESYGPLDYGAPERRHPVDAGRQLEMAAQLFREGRMPARGVEILEAIAGGWTFRRIARELGISVDVAKWRMREMRRIFRREAA